MRTPTIPVDITVTVLGVDVDKHLLASALMNLLQNAFQYTRERGLVTHTWSIWDPPISAVRFGHFWRRR